jgi:glycosyltransferase involved in cell wall biosynthesis
MSLKVLLTGQMKYMSQNGFKVITVSSDGLERNEVIEKEGVPHVIIPMTRSITIFQDLKCLWQLIRLIKKEKPDIVHTHTPKAGLLGMLAAKICGVKIKMHTIAGLPLMTATGGKRKLLEFIEKLTYWAADIVLPNSKSIYEFVKKHKFTSQKKLHIIGKGSSNGIDLDRFTKNKLDANRIQETKDKINYNPKNTYIVSIGRIVKDKGIVELVDAFSSAKSSFEGLKLVLVGTVERERTEELLPNKTLNTIDEDEDIILVGWTDYVEYYMFLSDLLVHASHREGFPNVPLQAGAMECPIICSEIFGNTDIVGNHSTGLYFDVNNKESLRECLNNALKNPKLMNQYALALRTEIEQKFDRKYIHEELKNFYLNALNE